MNVVEIQDPKNPTKRLLVSRDFYLYQAKAATLTPGQSVTTTVDIEADSSFVWLKSNYFVTVGAAAPQQEATRVIPNLNVQINDTGSGRLLQQEPVPISSMSGHEGLPAILPVPRIFMPKSTIQVTFTNESTAETYQALSLVFIGYKQWKY